ncbi:hypothetical protein SDC9_89240 [bioreactor metagenome]|uniref:Uncharacterized protein n=1 Tax=bioreactor metagenome TaxID=1076179 RepID=A0A644ZYD6_9ZZZZ
MNKYRSGHTPAADSIEAVLYGDIIIHLNAFYRNTILLCHIRGVSEIHDIAAVILHNQ